jgi:DNA-binding Xre family transcriptional regulator
MVKYELRFIMKDSDRDPELIKRFIAQARKREMTLPQLAAEVGMTISWARFLVNGRIKVLRFKTRTKVRKFLGEL